MIEKKKKILIVFAGLSVIAFLCFLIYLRFPYKIQGPCYMSPYSEWSLLQPSPEILMTKFTFYNPPIIKEMKLFQFERPDFVSFSLNNALKTGEQLQKGEVLGVIQSTENEIRFEELNGDLNVTKANLDFLSTGQKKSIQAEAYQNVRYAEAELSAFEPVLERKKDLFSKELIKAEEFELAEAQHTLLKLKVSIARANFTSVQTGEKPEEIEVIRKRIADIENRLDTFEQKLSSQTICSPFNGVLTGPTNESSILTVCRQDTIVVQIPVEERKIQYLKTGMNVRIYIPSSIQDKVEGTIDSIDKNFNIIAGKTMFIARVNIANENSVFKPGMTGFCKIYCDTVSFPVLVKRWWKESSGKSIF